MKDLKEMYLILENKTVFKGKSFGAYREAVGELVFSTNMLGYMDTLTDPANFGQLVISTFPEMGCHGTIAEEMAGEKASCFGYIVKDWCQAPSNWRLEGDLDTFLKEKDIPGIYGIDTRKLTKMVRDAGTMNAKISFTPDFTDDITTYNIVDAVKSVSVSEKVTSMGKDAKYRVVMWDFGTNNNMQKAFLDAGCDVTKVPYNTQAEEIIAMRPDGVVLSGGPGDPTELTNVITEIRQLKDIPTLGIGLGHQLLALSQGAKIEKLKFGHRGASVPVRNETTGKVYISSQNHSYQVVNSSVEGFGKISYRNVNDGTCEGIDYANIPAFSVQFNIESFSEPMNPGFLVGRFIEMMEGRKDAVK